MNTILIIWIGVGIVFALIGYEIFAMILMKLNFSSKTAKVSLKVIYWITAAIAVAGRYYMATTIMA